MTVDRDIRGAAAWCARALLVTLAASLTACAGDPPTHAPDDLAVTLGDSAFTVGVGATRRITLYVRDESGALANPPDGIEWTSSNSALATVDQLGNVRGVALGGPITISVAVDGEVASAVGTVIPNSVAITPAPSTIAVGESIQFSAAAYDAAGAVLDAGAVHWHTQAPSGTPIATITAAGVFTANSPGESMVFATIAGKRGEHVIGTPSEYDGSWHGARTDGVAIVLEVRYGAVRNIRFPAIPIQLCTTVQLNYDVLVPIVDASFSAPVAPQVTAGAGIVAGTFTSPLAMTGTQGSVILGTIICDSGQPLSGIRIFPANAFTATKQ